MVQRVLLLSSVGFLIACGHPAELPVFQENALHPENRNGIIYQDGKPFTGSVVKLNEEKDTLWCMGYYKGREHGEWKRFYAGGQMQELRYFDKGVKVNSLTRWWENGNMQLRVTFKNGEYDGVLKEWNVQGQLIREMHYKEGYEQGSQKMYYDNGKIRNNYVVKNGKRFGLLGTKNCVNVSDSIFKN